MRKWNVGWPRQKTEYKGPQVDWDRFQFPLTFTMHFDMAELGGSVHDDFRGRILMITGYREDRYTPWYVRFPWGELTMYGMEDKVRHNISRYIYDLVDARRAASIEAERLNLH